jgi:hypothetical protein
MRRCCGQATMVHAGHVNLWWGVELHVSTDANMGEVFPDNERIINAGNMRTVWPEFQCWFYSLVSPAEMVVLVARMAKHAT